MALAHIDFTSDGAIFFALLIIALVVLGVLLERASPRRKLRRRVDKHVQDKGGELIE